MVFCLPLVIGLAAIYISQRSDSELAYLTTAVAAVSFLVSLVLLPWQLKVSLLALVCVLAQRQLTTLNPSGGSVGQPTVAELNSERSPTESGTVAESEWELVGKYRGATWKADLGGEPSEIRLPLADLKYRGASFWNSSPRA
jgi:hypothetical protein